MSPRPTLNTAQSDPAAYRSPGSRSRVHTCLAPSKSQSDSFGGTPQGHQTLRGAGWLALARRAPAGGRYNAQAGLRAGRRVRRRLPDAAPGAQHDRPAEPTPRRSCPGRRPGTGSGMDQCTAVASPSSSWARSQTVITRSPSYRTSLMCRGRSRGSGRRWRPAAAMAPGSIAAAGWVPAETAGTVLAWRHSAAARWERAELAVHTNSTRSAVAGRRGGQRVQGAGDQLQVGAAPVAFRPAAGDDPGLFQHVHVVREQVGRHGQHGSQLGGGRVPGQQRVGDPQPGRVGQRGVQDGAPGQVRGSISSH